MARSQGIPTRVVSGYSASRDGSWQGHAWAESYIGEWVPVDPTWLEAGHLDGTHIQLSQFPDKVYEAQAYALMTPGAKLKISWSNPVGGTASGVRITGLKQNKPLPGLEFGAGADKIQIGEDTVVYAKINGSDYRLIELTLAPCTSAGVKPVELLDEPTQVVAIRPGTQEIVAWRVRSNPQLSRGYVWTCPLIINSPYFENREVRLTIDPRSSGPIPFSAWFSRNSVLIGENLTVYYEVEADAPGERIGFITDSGVFEFPVIRGVHSLNLTPRRLGLNYVLVYSSKGGALKLPFTVSREPSVRIKTMTTQGAVIQGKPFTVSVSIENAKPSVESALISVLFNGENKTARGAIAGIYTVNFTFVPSSEGPANLSARVSGEGFYDDYSQLIEVKPQPSVRVSKITYAFVGRLTTVVLNLTGTGNPLLLNATIDGEKIPAQFGEVSIEAAPGERTLELEWLDEAGNYYYTSLPIDVPAAPPQPSPTPTPSPVSAPTCGVASILFLLSLIAAIACCKEDAYRKPF